MRNIIDLVIFCVMVALSICGMSAIMWLVGLGSPNCEPTTAGYFGFYATLFGCSLASCFGAWGVVSFACVMNKFLTKERI